MGPTNKRFGNSLADEDEEWSVVRKDCVCEFHKSLVAKGYSVRRGEEGSLLKLLSRGFVVLL